MDDRWPISGGRAEGAPRTSVTDPLYVDWVLPDRLGITFLPGKRAPSLFGSPWVRDLGADLDRLVAERVALLVSLVEDAELERLGVPDLVEAATRRGVRVWRAPVRDGGVPTEEAMRAILREVEAEPGRVVVHCRGGLGRAGTVAACLLVAGGEAPETAVARVRAARPGAVENALQERFVVRFAATVAG